MRLHVCSLVFLLFLPFFCSIKNQRFIRYMEYDLVLKVPFWLALFIRIRFLCIFFCALLRWYQWRCIFLELFLFCSSCMHPMLIQVFVDATAIVAFRWRAFCICIPNIDYHVWSTPIFIFTLSLTHLAISVAYCEKRGFGKILAKRFGRRFSFTVSKWHLFTPYHFLVVSPALTNSLANTIFNSAAYSASTAQETVPYRKSKYGWPLLHSVV